MKVPTYSAVLTSSYRHSKGLGGVRESGPHSLPHTLSLPRSLPFPPASPHCPSISPALPAAGSTTHGMQKNSASYTVVILVFERRERSQFPIPLCPGDVTVICEVCTNSPPSLPPSPLPSPQHQHASDANDAMVSQSHRWPASFYIARGGYACLDSALGIRSVTKCFSGLKPKELRGSSLRLLSVKLDD